MSKDKGKWVKIVRLIDIDEANDEYKLEINYHPQLSWARIEDGVVVLDPKDNPAYVGFIDAEIPRELGIYIE